MVATVHCALAPLQPVPPFCIFVFIMPIDFCILYINLCTLRWATDVVASLLILFPHCLANQNIGTTCNNGCSVSDFCPNSDFVSYSTTARGF